ncbi:MAG: hypothetical protein RL701_4798 [Pseudomonadota bacterium]|jgi:uncharacterized membrane protein YedE/YeeE
MRGGFAPHALSLVVGLLFGTGLVLSGMTQPEKVIGFLDPFGHFDASLLFVMVGAISVHTIAYRALRRRTQPMFGGTYLVSSRRDLDAKLLVGACLFGLGWGLGGYCPGPGIVSLAGGGWSALIFVTAMLAGIFLTAKLEATAKAKSDEHATRAGAIRIPTANRN